MFENVLVGVDGRGNGRDAIALARHLTDPAGTLTLAHVRGGESQLVHAVGSDVALREHRASEELLARERDDVQAKLVSIAAASPGRGLHEQAEREGADLLVVGACSRSLLGRAMLGDDTRAALNGSPCAVAIAAAGYARNPAPIATVGVAYDDSPESVAALAMARRLAVPTRATVYALEVVSMPSSAFAGLIPPATGQSIELMLDEANSRLNRLPGVEGRAVYGLAGEELARFGDDLDILLVGSRGYGPMRRLVLGSTSSYLERHARCSLLVLARNAPVAVESAVEAMQRTELDPAAI